MSLINTLFFLNCDSSPLYDEQNNNFAITTNGTESLVDAVFDKGLALTNFDNAFTLSTNPTSAFTLSFWLKSTNPGLSTDEDSLNIAILGKCDFSVGVTATTMANTSSFCVYEETLENDYNQLVVALMSGSNSISFHRSEPYKVGIFHHFWIAYSSAQLLNIFVDGVSNTITSSAPIPVALGNNTFTLKINKNVIGNNSKNLKNEGIIDDIFILNYYNVDAEDIARTIKYGGLYVCDDLYNSYEEAYQGFLFDDAGSKEITGIVNSNNNIFVSKNDGTLLLGHKKIWENRIIFNSKKELSIHNIYSRDGTVPTFENGNLTIKNQIIRI